MLSEKPRRPKQYINRNSRPLVMSIVASALLVMLVTAPLLACSPPIDSSPTDSSSGRDEPSGASDAPTTAQPAPEPDYQDYYKPLLDEYRNPSAATIASLDDVDNIYSVFTEGYATEFYDKLLVDIMRTDVSEPQLAELLQPDDVYFAYNDLNGDKVPELIVGIDCGSQGIMPLDIYGLGADNEIVFIYRFFDMNAVRGFSLVTMDGSPLVYEWNADAGIRYDLLMEVTANGTMVVDEYSAETDWASTAALPPMSCYHNSSAITEAEWTAAVEQFATMPDLALDWVRLKAAQS